jgi:cation diffusion facilitator family transporter
MEKRKIRVALSSAAVSFVLLVLKLAVGLITGSIGILSDAVDSGLDLVASVITFFAVRVSKKPADEHHHYGHGKVENIAALAETLLLFITCIWIIYEASKRLISGNLTVEVTWYSFALMFLSIALNVSRVKALKKVARETNSHALEADALNFNADIYASMVVLIGLTFAYFGIKGADAVAAIFVSFIVLYISFKLGGKSIGILIDAAPKELTEQVRDAVLEIEEVIRVERLRIRPTGFSYFVDAVVAVSRKMPLQQTTMITKEVKTRIRKIIPEGDVVINIKPIALKDETIAEKIQIIAKNHNADVHDISVQEIGGKKFVNFDLEVESKLNLEKAHKKTSEIEKSIKEELGEDLNVVIHVEPGPIFSNKGDELDKKTLGSIEKVLVKIKRDIRQIKGFRDITGRKIDGAIFLTLSCMFDEKIALGESHDISEKIESKLREKIPNLQRAIIHLEPSRKMVK